MFLLQYNIFITKSDTKKALIKSTKKVLKILCKPFHFLAKYVIIIVRKGLVERS